MTIKKTLYFYPYPNLLASQNLACTMIKGELYIRHEIKILNQVE
jgi:hypothetical protein